MDAYKVYRYLDFLASLLEHPRAKALLLKEGAIEMLTGVLDRCLGATDIDGVQILAGRSSAKCGFPMLSWCLPVFKSFSLIFISQASLHNDLHKFANVSIEDSILILKYLLRFCQVISAGKELLACLAAFKELGSCNEGRSALAAAFYGLHYIAEDRSSTQLSVDSRMTPQSFFPKNSSQHVGNVPIATGSPGFYDPRFLPNQPPLPPMPPPSTVAALISQTSDSNPSQSSPFVNSMNEGQHPPTAYQIRSDYPSAFNNGSTSRSSISSPSGAARPPPPLPPTPPPFSSSPYNLTSNRTSISQSSVYNQTSVGTTELSHTVPSGARVNTYSPPALVPHMVFSRPGSNSTSIYGNVPTQLQGDNPNMLQNLSVPQSSMQSIHTLAQLQPLQPPQLPRPPQPPQHLRPPIQASQQLEQGSLQSPVPMHSLQMLQQPMVSPMQAYYQSQQHEFAHIQQQVDHSQQQVLPQSGDATSQQQQDRSP